MGKEQNQQQQNLEQQPTQEGPDGNGCGSMGRRLLLLLWRRAHHELTFRCVFVLILSLCLLVSAVFMIFPFRSAKVPIGFDARDEIKLAATVQAYFRLQKPVSQLVKQIERLEYDIFSEISIPYTKVAILSMHQTGSNWTDVVFGVLSDPINSTINPVYLSVLRSSLIELFHGETNLTLTASTFGQPSMFEILKFPGGITVIPVQYALIWQMPQILFNFTLNNSISEILENFDELRDQLQFGLHLRPYESIYVQVTNVAGSTILPPVTIQASVMPDFGILLPQRLKQLALTITKSHAKNLGLDNSLFGRVKSVILSSYLKGTLHGTPISPSPAPSPDFASPEPSQSVSPALSPSNRNEPCPRSHSHPPLNSPAPRTVRAPPPPRINPSHSIPTHSHPVAPPPKLPPHPSPPPGASYNFSPAKAAVQAYFRLQRPVSQLVNQIERLQYDIFSEISIPHTKVAILSMHQAGSNCTDVVFGVLSDPINSTINPVYLSVLRSSLVGLFLGQSNLSLTASRFGRPSMFEILKFPGGITVIPVQYASVWQIPRILFNFTLNSSISKILDNFDELKDQLEFGLHLRPYENIYVQVTSVAGSTIVPLVTIQASVMPDFGILLPQRLKQLALTITKTHAKNLGLDNSLFGRVKSVILSSYLRGTLHAPISPSPAPPPDLGDHAEPSLPAHSKPSQPVSPALSPSDHNHRCSNSHPVPPSNSTAPSTVNAPPPPKTNSSHSIPTPVPAQHSPPDLSPSAGVSYSSSPAKGLISPSLAPSPLTSSSSSLVVNSLYREIWLLGLSGLFIFLLGWPS